MRRATFSIGARAAVFLAVLGLCATATVALAQQVVPPGNSGADQYFESVPKGEGKGSVDEPAAPVAPVQELNAPVQEPNALGKKGKKKPAKIDRTTPTATRGTESIVGDVADNSSSSDGIGILLPILLGLTLIAAIAYAARRRLSPA